MVLPLGILLVFTEFVGLFVKKFGVLFPWLETRNKKFIKKQNNNFKIKNKNKNKNKNGIKRWCYHWEYWWYLRSSLDCL